MRMLLKRGELDGARVLKADTIAPMSQNQTPISSQPRNGKKQKPGRRDASQACSQVDALKPPATSRPPGISAAC